MTVKTRASIKADIVAHIYSNTTREVSGDEIADELNDLADSAVLQDEYALHIADVSNPHATTKTQVGLGNADNTTDLDKPISTAAQAAIDLKAPLASPALTGTPTAPTPTMGDTTTKIATMAALDAATNAAITGYQWKVPVEVVAIANLTLSGEQTIDSVLTSANRVAATAQTAPAENGIWISAAGAWARATDMNTAAEFPHAAFLVNSGTLAGTQWKCNNTTNPVVDTDAIIIIKVGSGLLLDFADAPAAVTGTEVDTVMSPSTTAAAIEGYAYDAPRAILAHSATFPRPATNLERWRNAPLDAVLDLKANGAGGDDEADTAALEEFAACTASRGHQLFIPATPSGLRIKRPIVFTSHRNILICGPSGGSLVKPSAYLNYVGTDPRGMFDLVTVWGFTLKDISLVCGASGIGQLVLCHALPDPALSSVLVNFENVNFASTVAPSQLVWVRNSQEVTFRRCAFTNTTYACVVGDLSATNDEDTGTPGLQPGTAGGGVGRLLFEQCYIAGDIQLRLYQGVQFNLCAFAENQGLFTRGVQITEGGSGTVGQALAFRECDIYGMAGDLAITESFCTLARTYGGVIFENNRITGYKVGLDLFGTSGAQGHVEFRGNSLEITQAATTPIGCRINSTFGGTVSGHGHNSMTAGMVSDGGREFEDSRTEASQLLLFTAGRGVHASLGANVTMTVGSNTTILTTPSSGTVYADGGLQQIDAQISVVNAAATTTIVFWLEFNSVELARTRATHVMGASESLTIPFQAKVKCGPASGTFRIMGFQQTGTAATIRAATAALGGQTQISVKPIDI